MAVVLATPATATENKLLLDPDNSVSDGTPVQVVIYTDISETDQAMAASFDIEYDPDCIQGVPSFDSTGSGWLVGSGATAACTNNPAPGVLRFSSSVGLNPPISGHVVFGTLTFTCNTASCESSLNFNNPKYTDGSMSTIHPATDSGTFRCTSTLGVEDGGEENEGGDSNSGGRTITTPSPTPSPGSTTSPIQDTTPPQTPSLTPTPTPTPTLAANSNPTPASSSGVRQTPESPGFELMIAVGMLTAAVCLIRKRGPR